MSYAYDLQRDLPTRPDNAWRALTEADLLSRWFMTCDQNLGTLPMGGTFTLTDPDAKGWSGILDGQLLERNASELLVYRTDERKGTSSTTLTWRLTATEHGTRLQLHHAGWEGLRGILTAQFLRMDWRSLIAKNLTELLHTTDR